LILQARATSLASARGIARGFRLLFTKNTEVISGSGHSIRLSFINEPGYCKFDGSRRRANNIPNQTLLDTANCELSKTSS
jgi:hypothetical protein